MIVIKRDGREVPFDKEKIRTAIGKAFKEVEFDCDSEVLSTAVDEITEMLHRDYSDKISIENIQDCVEFFLMKFNPVAAKAYITYRYKHALARDKYSELMEAIKNKLGANDVQNQNANVDEKSFGGRRGEAANLMMKQFALDYIMSPMARNNHLNNEVYVHDLDYYAVGAHNCLSVPFDKLLANGFNTRQTDVRPANSVNTAFQLVAVIFQLQSLQQFGGVSATHIDWTMIPYVRKSFRKHYNTGITYLGEPLVRGIIPENTSIEDERYKTWYPKAYNYAMDMTVKETYQAVEGLYHNLNTLQSRSGNQLPFTSINYGTCTLPEGRLVTKALLEISIKGIGKLHKTSIFPNV